MPARQQIWRMGKERLVVCHRLDGLPMLAGVRQDLVACHDAAFDLIEHTPGAQTRPARRPCDAGWRACAARISSGRISLRGHLLALQYALARLSNHTLDQGQHLLRLLEEPLGLLPRLLL
jgi:hypothetical protein